MHWWMNEEKYVGDLVKDGVTIKIYWRCRFVDDDTYALVDEEGKLISFLWMGDIVNPEDAETWFFWEE